MMTSSSAPPILTIATGMLARPISSWAMLPPAGGWTSTCQMPTPHSGARMTVIILARQLPLPVMSTEMAMMTSSSVPTVMRMAEMMPVRPISSWAILPPAGGWTSTCQVPMPHSGARIRVVASAGDVNGDGYDDFLIGAYYDGDGRGDGTGQTYLILGNAAAGWGMDFDLSNADASFWGEDAGDNSGLSVASAGDVNGDGYDDFLIGAAYSDDGGDWAGQTYLILGNAAAGWGMDFDLSGADASFWGEDQGDRSGYRVASAR